MEMDSKHRKGRPTIGDLAQRTGCSMDTIRYYERIGLLPPVERTRGGHRLYAEGHERRLAFIRRSRRLGLNLAQVRQIVGGIERDAYTCEDVRTLLSDCAAGVSRQIAELQEIEMNLRMMLRDCGDAELANCRMIEAMLAGEHAEGEPSCCC